MRVTGLEVRLCGLRAQPQPYKGLKVVAHSFAHGGCKLHQNLLCISTREFQWHEISSGILEMSHHMLLFPGVVHE